jgi:hypothetical protein
MVVTDGWWQAKTGERRSPPKNISKFREFRAENLNAIKKIKPIAVA